MSKSTTFLNYIAFLTLYITSFVFIYKKNTEFIGFYLLFIVNAACTLYNMFYFSEMSNALNLITRTITLSVTLSGILHTIALLFIIIMLSKMKVKYQNTFGTPIKLPPIYKQRLDDFKYYIVITFVLCIALLFSFVNFFDALNINFVEEMKTISDILRNKFAMLALIIAFIPIVLSTNQVSTANSFSILTRQDLIN